VLQNILEKFNPGAKQLITSSKAYLKSLHGTSSASKVFIESLAKLAVNAHEGGTTDIGTRRT
jgi:BAI1-associated protein 2